jgi:L-alanine-DL-glutamate epimerase-like enolase superfamily enzyme
MAKLQDVQLYPVHLPYNRAIHWRAHAERGVDALFVRLRTADGFVGAAETPVRKSWHKTDLAELVENIQRVCQPRMRNLDVLSEVDATFLEGTDVHPLARSLMDCALFDLRANARGEPLHTVLGAGSGHVTVSYTVTRATPAAMASDAEQACKIYGFRALKIKTGQGPHLDDDALHSIRSAVGHDVWLCADANNTHDPIDLPAYREIYQRHDVAVVEDPVPLTPDRAALSRITTTLGKPILVDNACRSTSAAMAFLDAGAQALSVKVMKTGLTNSMAILNAARAYGVKAAIGLGASSALGAMFTLSLAAGVAPADTCAPCEETFFTLMPQVLLKPMLIREGTIKLPASTGFHDLIDWKMVDALRK